MKIAFFVNSMADEYPNYATTVLAAQAVAHGHDVYYLTPEDFVLEPGGGMSVHVRAAPTAPKGGYADHTKFFAELKKVAGKTSKLDIAELDVLMLRNDPSNDAQDRPWAEDAGILFGREAVKRGVIVLNDPDSLGRAINKMYFESFPVEVRAETLITKHPADIKEFAKKHGGNIILKPLQGSGGSGVFKVDGKSASNMNQMIEAIERDGYIIAQEYVKAATKGDIRLFMMNGEPLCVDKKFCALRRVQSPDDIRSNIHAGGKAVKAEVGEIELRVAELIRPKLISDGMFLVGIDIVGDKILEVNVFSPGNLHTCNKLAGKNFAEKIIAGIERKVEIKREFPGQFNNRALASL